MWGTVRRRRASEDDHDAEATDTAPGAERHEKPGAVKPGSATVSASPATSAMEGVTESVTCVCGCGVR